MKKITKFFVVISAAILSLATLSFAACGKEEESALRGTFTYQDTKAVTVSQDPLDMNDKSHLYSNVYPFMDAYSNVAYNMDQSLKLRRDYTYIYDYSITLKNPGDWGGEFATLSVSITGTFDFVDEGGGVYTVALSNPTGGTQSVYGSTITGGNIYSWSKHGEPDFILDYETLSHKDGYKYDEYVRSHIVVVDKNDRSLSDDIFFPQLLNYICNYSNY